MNPCDHYFYRNLDGVVYCVKCDADYEPADYARGRRAPAIHDDIPASLNFDPVNNPAHYTTDPSGVECISITRHRSFNVGNAIKYLWRAGLKDQTTTVQDLQKALFYINDEIARLSGQNR